MTPFAPTLTYSSGTLGPFDGANRIILAQSMATPDAQNVVLSSAAYYLQMMGPYGSGASFIPFGTCEALFPTGAPQTATPDPPSAHALFPSTSFPAVQQFDPIAMNVVGSPLWTGAAMPLSSTMFGSGNQYNEVRVNIGVILQPAT